MNAEFSRLTVYLGERDRTGDSFQADALLDLFESREVVASCLFRGSEGFGLKHHLQTDRLLTLSEDLPLVATAVGKRQNMEDLADEVKVLVNPGLITMEDLLVPDLADDGPKSTAGLRGSAKLTVYLGRRDRIDGVPAHRAVVDLLRGCGLDGAAVNLAVDGLLRGERFRARFFGTNSNVPMEVVAVGGQAEAREALDRLSRLVPDSLATIEDVEIVKRDGKWLTDRTADDQGDKGHGSWTRLTVYTGEQSSHHGNPLQPQLIRRLRESGAIGATGIRGAWGFHGDHEPHGDSIWSVRRRVPNICVVVDTSDQCGAWLRIIDEVTDETGLVTKQDLSAAFASSPEETRGSIGDSIGT